MRNLALLSLAAFLSACAVGPNYVKPDVQTAPAFAGAATAAFTAQDPVARFWTQFGDEELDRLVADALAANHDLRIALAHVKEARALNREAKFDLAPTVTAGAGYTKQRFSNDQTAAAFGREQELYDAGFDASWELDLFGRVRRGIEARHAEVESAEATLRDAQVIVTAEVTRTYFELRGAQSELEVAKRNVVNQQETLKLTSVRLDAGRGTELDTSRAQAQLSTTLASVSPLEAAVSRDIHKLSVLTGREPDALTGELAPTRDLPGLPGVAAVGNPADLLRRRPDIRVAERDLAASNARIGVAIGDYFPKVSFTGSIGYAAGSSGALGDSGTDAYTIAPGISWAAFDLGRVHARVEGARASNEASLARYEQAVLRALEDAEDALVTHARARERLTHVELAAESSATAARLANLRFQSGLVDFLQVLDAERTQLEAEDALAQSRTDAATSLIAVYKALGGGWEGAPLPTARPLADTGPPAR
ncbi:MAG TPA: efflux transporter outer membrane subunit [Steroidobacteraceae bacterium]|nr:efflux transporter outer membrane subunit [Steroidobacteraceae bacterium]